MRRFWAYMILSALVGDVVACKRQDDSQQPPAAPPATAAYGYQGYPPPPATYQPYPPAPTATYTQAPPPGPVQTQPAPASAAPAPPAPASSGQLAVPGPVAFQCQNDVPCGTHHCNVQYGKCAFPCQSNIDCISPNSCLMGLCVPVPPTTH
ncbi:MAG: hypothetical protein ABSC94_26550 [Polyangiaceae bacterium]|jgi:hypothetical protein